MRTLAVDQLSLSRLRLQLKIILIQKCQKLWKNANQSPRWHLPMYKTLKAFSFLWYMTERSSQSYHLRNWECVALDLLINYVSRYNSHVCTLKSFFLLIPCLPPSHTSVLSSRSTALSPPSSQHSLLHNSTGLNDDNDEDDDDDEWWSWRDKHCVDSGWFWDLAAVTTVSSPCPPPCFRFIWCPSVLPPFPFSLFGWHTAHRFVDNSRELTGCNVNCRLEMNTYKWK